MLIEISTTKAQRLYQIPSGMGGTFDVLVIGELPAGELMVHGEVKQVPERYITRIHMPSNPDFHGWVTESGKVWFEANAKDLGPRKIKGLPRRGP